MVFTYLMILSILLCVLTAVLVYYSKAHFYIKLTSLPLVIFFCLSMLYYLVEIAGAPINGLPKGKWNYLLHQIEDHGKTIVLWTWLERYEDYRHYKFPYTRETMKKLNEAMEKKKKGKKIKGEFVKKLKGDELKISEEGTRKSDNPVKAYER